MDYQVTQEEMNRLTQRYGLLVRHASLFSEFDCQTKNRLLQMVEGAYQSGKTENNEKDTTGAEVFSHEN